MNPTATTKTPKTKKAKDTKVLGVALLVLALIWVVSWAYRQPHAGPRTPPPPGNGTAGAGARQEPAPDPVEYGTFMVTTDRMTECEIKPGQGFDASPVRLLEYDWYVNGTLLKHMSVRDTNNPKYPTHETKSIGYRLTPGQGVSEIKFAYVRYTSPTPPSDWYARALRAGD